MRAPGLGWGILLVMIVDGEQDGKGKVPTAWSATLSRQTMFRRYGFIEQYVGSQLEGSHHNPWQGSCRMPT
jgi:hypothetical protein